MNPEIKSNILCFASADCTQKDSPRLNACVYIFQRISKKNNSNNCTIRSTKKFFSIVFVLLVSDFVRKIRRQFWDIRIVFIYARKQKMHVHERSDDTKRRPHVRNFKRYSYFSAISQRVVASLNKFSPKLKGFNKVSRVYKVLTRLNSIFKSYRKQCKVVDACKGRERSISIKYFRTLSTKIGTRKVTRRFSYTGHGSKFLGISTAILNWILVTICTVAQTFVQRKRFLGTTNYQRAFSATRESSKENGLLLGFELDWENLHHSLLFYFVLPSTLPHPACSELFAVFNGVLCICLLSSAHAPLHSCYHRHWTGQTKCIESLRKTLRPFQSRSKIGLYRKWKQNILPDRKYYS